VVMSIENGNMLVSGVTVIGIAGLKIRFWNILLIIQMKL
jgi:hypothetical protein